ncbi:hypothetical protein NDA18_003178 [Ustilago nuda]|nr:hypothetical protein NDA18_003178 [Ustilago nuda]
MTLLVYSFTQKEVCECRHDPALFPPTTSHSPQHLVAAVLLSTNDLSESQTLCNSGNVASGSPCAPHNVSQTGPAGVDVLKLYGA